MYQIVNNAKVVACDETGDIGILVGDKVVSCGGSNLAYDTRKTTVVGPREASGTTNQYGEIKVADKLDFNFESATSLSCMCNGSLLYDELPVRIYRPDDENAPIILVDADSGSHNYAIYIANEAEAQYWWGSDEPNPYTPGLYLCLYYDAHVHVDVSYGFTCSEGELKIIEPKYMYDVVFGLDNDNNRVVLQGSFESAMEAHAKNGCIRALFVDGRASAESVFCDALCLSSSGRGILFCFVSFSNYGTDHNGIELMPDGSVR